MSEELGSPGGEERIEQDAYMCEYVPRKVTLEWLPLSKGQFPTEPSSSSSYVPFPADSNKFNGNYHFVGRYKGIICPLVKEEGIFVAPHETGNHQAPLLSNYEILITPKESLCWRFPKADGTLPVRAAPAITGSGVRIYIGKMDKVGVGTVRLCQKTFTWRFYSYDDGNDVDTDCQPFSKGFKILCFV